jgi:hypothetical protein
VKNVWLSGICNAAQHRYLNRAVLALLNSPAQAGQFSNSVQFHLIKHVESFGVYHLSNQILKSGEFHVKVSTFSFLYSVFAAFCDCPAPVA